MLNGLALVVLAILSVTWAAGPAGPAAPRNVSNNSKAAYLQPRFRQLYRNGRRVSSVDNHHHQLQTAYSDYNNIQAAFPLYPVTMFQQPSSTHDLSQTRTQRRKRSTSYTSSTGRRMSRGRTGSRIAVVRSDRRGFSSRLLDNRYDRYGGILGGRRRTDMFGSRRLSQLRKNRRLGLGRRFSSFYPSRQFDW